MPIEGEYYWIKLHSEREWEPAQYDSMGYWETIGYEVPILNDADVIVGQHIPKPDK